MIKTFKIYNKIAILKSYLQKDRSSKAKKTKHQLLLV